MLEPLAERRLGDPQQSGGDGLVPLGPPNRLANQQVDGLRKARQSFQAEEGVAGRVCGLFRRGHGYAHYL